MTTSRTSGLSKPTGDDKVSRGTLRYIHGRNRQRAFDLVTREFKKSGITQAALARRLGKAPEVICRLLARPRNWELDTFAELMFGISGSVPRYTVEYPLLAHTGANLADVFRLSGAKTEKPDRPLPRASSTAPTSPVQAISLVVVG